MPTPYYLQWEVEVKNTTRQDIVLPNRTTLGRLQLIQSVVSVEVKLKIDDTFGQSCSKVDEGTNTLNTAKNCDEPITSRPKHLDQVDLNELTSEQRNAARALLVEEADVFAVDHSDISRISDFQMDIN